MSLILSEVSTEVLCSTSVLVDGSAPLVAWTSDVVAFATIFWVRGTVDSDDEAFIVEVMLRSGVLLT